MSEQSVLSELKFNIVVSYVYSRDLYTRIAKMLSKRKSRKEIMEYIISSGGFGLKTCDPKYVQRCRINQYVVCIEGEQDGKMYRISIFNANSEAEYKQYMLEE